MRASYPIVIKSGGTSTETLGAIVFDACTVEDKTKRQPMFYDDVGGARLKEVTGTLEVKTDGKSERIELNQALLDKWFPWSAELKEYAHFDVKGLQFTPDVPDAKPPFPPVDGWLRGTSQYVLWGKEGKPITFAIALKKIGKAEIRAVPVRLIAPSGKVTELAPAKGGEPQSYTYVVAEKGLHRVVVEAGNHAAMLRSADHLSNLMSLRGDYHFVYRAGPLYFLVPEGVAEFALKVAGGGGTELVKATIRDAAGQIVATKDNIGHGELFPFKRPSGKASEVWSLSLDKPSQGVLEDIQILLEGVPPFLAASPEAILKPLK